MSRPGCAPTLELRALPGLPVVQPGDDLVELIINGLVAAGLELAGGDALVIASKIVSRVEDRFVDLASIEPSERARGLAAETEKDPRLVELILRESRSISRTAPGVLIVRHNLGLVSANAAIDQSNARLATAEPGSGPWALLLPARPDVTARAICAELERRTGARIGVIISDSLGRPFRHGSVGAAIGVAGMPALVDMRGKSDLFGRALEHTQTALADQVAAAADLVAGQADEGRAVVHIRGLTFEGRSGAAADLIRDPERDLYA